MAGEIAENKSSSQSKPHKHKSKETCKALVFFTPLFVIMLCLGLIVLFGYRTFVSAESYARFIFNDKAKIQNAAEDNKYRNADALPMKGTTKVVKTADPVDGETSEPVIEEHEIIYPYYGDQYAKITIDNDSANIKDYPVYWGDSDDLLDLGVVQSNYSAYIGATGRVVLAAHNHTYFRYLPNVKVGDTVTLTTDYGVFTYKVRETQILYDDDTSLLYYDPNADEITDDLILYTCWNNGYMGLSDQRLYVICDVVSKEFYN